MAPSNCSRCTAEIAPPRTEKGSMSGQLACQLAVWLAGWPVGSLVEWPSSRQNHNISRSNRGQLVQENIIAQEVSEGRSVRVTLLSATVQRNRGDTEL
eukprot:3305546-Heterocapsa_arctica.AAC.1